MNGKKIDVDKGLFELDKLVDDCRLSQSERMNQKLNIQALRSVVREWKEMKDNGEENE